MVIEHTNDEGWPLPPSVTVLTTEPNAAYHYSVSCDARVRKGGQLVSGTCSRVRDAPTH